MAQCLAISFKWWSKVDLWTFEEKVKVTSLYNCMRKIFKKKSFFFFLTIEGWCILFGTDTLLTKSMEIYQLQGEWLSFDLCFKVLWIKISNDFSGAPGPFSTKFLLNIFRCMEDIFIWMVAVCWHAHICLKLFKSLPLQS